LTPFNNPLRVLSGNLPLLPLNRRQHPQKEGDDELSRRRARQRGFMGTRKSRRALLRRLFVATAGSISGAIAIYRR
jgi:hypothetical protein